MWAILCILDEDELFMEQAYPEYITEDDMSDVENENHDTNDFLDGQNTSKSDVESVMVNHLPRLQSKKYNSSRYKSKKSPAATNKTGINH